MRGLPRGLVPHLAAFTWVIGAGCSSQLRGSSFDVLHDAAPLAPHCLAHEAVTDAEYQQLVTLGAQWFRNETFGDERAVTDVAGLMGGVVEVPRKGAPGVYDRVPVRTLFFKAIDDLDGKPGNLFSGDHNGGPQGNGYTSDLVIRFPEGARLFGGVPVPPELHTGLDVEAGSPLPLGIVAIDAPDADQGLAYLPRPSDYDAHGSTRRIRLGLTCALCHYSLDVDWDGKADLKSAALGQTTPGSRYRPEDAWAGGNQDLHFGWLFGLTTNPLLGATVLSGPVGTNTPNEAIRFVDWVRKNYVSSPIEVQRQVVVGMLVQPRGYADDTPDARHDPVQLPSLYTFRNWPYNYDGALINAADRNNSVWTAALDFTGLIGLAGDRSGQGRATLWWETPSIYSLLPSELYADLMTRYAPAALADPSAQRKLIDDILGVSDGVPGMLDPNEVVVMEGATGVMPPSIFAHPANIAGHRQRTPANYLDDASKRNDEMALLGTRVRTPDTVLALPAVAAILNAHLVSRDELFTDAVSAALDWQTPPANLSPMLAGQWDTVEKGYREFKRAGCDGCHAGAFLTDNKMSRLAPEAKDEFGIAAPSTAGWQFLARDEGPAVSTEPDRALGSRPQQLFVTPSYDPATGLATTTGGVVLGVTGDKHVGYKTITLRNLWETAPYLHDGGVGVAVAPWIGKPSSIAAILDLARTAPQTLFYGMGAILDYRESHPSDWIRQDAALSLQALLLEGERQKVVSANKTPNYHVVPGGVLGPTVGAPPAEVVTMRSLGVGGTGHEFWIDDTPGGDRITAVVTFLLALDDKPCELVQGDLSHCKPSTALPEKPTCTPSSAH